jgi:exopolyphosphatase/guanosine-5'-triphosphate,3'-diphosphate pyrophosphatase
MARRALDGTWASAYPECMGSVAAIDIGSNSVRVLIVDANGSELWRATNITRLAEGVDQTGRLAEGAIERTLDVLDGYVARIRDNRVGRLRVTGTSAARDAQNRAEFFARVRASVGQEPELLSGDAEAALAFAGATRGRSPSEGPFVTLDIGGGSTEFAFGLGQPEHSISLNVGCVRVTERFLHGDPPAASEFDRVREFLNAEFARVDQAVPCRRGKTWIGMAGTVTSLAARDAGLRRYDARVTHGYRLRRERVMALHEELAKLSTSERAPLLIEPRRAGVMLGGSIVLVEVFRYFELQEIVVSERDILDGLVASLRETGASS